MILGTGASGIVGHYVVEALVKSNHRVRATYRKNSNRSRLSHLRDEIDWVEADVLDIPALSEAFQGIEKIVHCANCISRNRQIKQFFHRFAVTFSAKPNSTITGSVTIRALLPDS